MLQDSAIEIDDVKGSVRSSRHMDRAKAFVGGSQEFGLGIGIFPKQGTVGFGQEIAPDKIAGGFGDKCVPIKIAREQVAIENEGRTGGGEFLQVTFAQHF